MKVLLVGENASARMGGEAAAPFHYFRHLPERGVETWLIAHARVRDELRRAFPDRVDRMHFVEDTRFDKGLYAAARRLPDKVSAQTFGVLAKTVGQLRMRRVAERLVATAGVELVHQVYPISPKEPSAFYGMGVPVVIGPPLSGGMRYPPGFEKREGRVARTIEAVGRAVSGTMNRLLPGKLRADALLVANSQTREALPRGCRGRVYDSVSEVAVDPSVFQRSPRDDRADDGRAGEVRFVYLGRLVDWKAIDLLLEAFSRAAKMSQDAKLSLHILGDGKERHALEAQSQRLGLNGRVHFAGWVNAEQAAAGLRESNVFVLPSLRESGGIVVVEAMAIGLPVVVTDWGGPALSVTDECGIRVTPSSRDGLIEGFAEAMVRLAGSPELRAAMGEAAARRVREGPFTWPKKIDQTIEIYAETLRRFRARPAGA